MTVQDEIRKLEKRAKEAVFERERFEKLRDEVSNVISRLHDIMGTSKTATRKKFHAEPIIEELYKRLEIERLPVRTKHIERAITAQGTSPQSINIAFIREQLLKKEGVRRRKDGLAVVLYYVPQDVGRRKAQEELAKKFPSTIRV